MRSFIEEYGALALWTVVTAGLVRTWHWLNGEEPMDLDLADKERSREGRHAATTRSSPQARSQTAGEDARSSAVAVSAPPSAPARPTAPEAPPAPVGQAAERTRPEPERSRLDWDRLAAEAVAVDLVRLFESRGYRPVWKRKDGEKATFHVPWRPDRHPSLGVYRRGEVWFWTDHARNESGTAIQALERLDGLSRTEAIRRLTGHLPDGWERRGRRGRARATPPAEPARSSEPDTGDSSESPEREARKQQAVALYQAARAALTPARQAQIDAYWRAYGVTPPVDLGAGWIELDAGDRRRPYVVIPLPYAHKVWAVECRLLDGSGPADRAWRARTYGPKDLWVQWRADRERVLVTESVLDALSALALWPEQPWSLVALNGVGNVRRLPALVQQAARAGRPIRTVRLALDADDAGHAAATQADALLAPLGVRLEREEAHARAGAKDLNKLLLLRRAAAKEEATHEAP